MKILIKNGQIVDIDKTYISDILIEDEKIINMGTNLKDDDATVYDATGMYVLPGAIDSHTHFDLDVGITVTADDFYSGTRAAIAGGTTTIIDFATQTKNDTLANALIEWKNKADKKAFCDYAFHMAIIDWNDAVKKEMSDMVSSGVTSFKMYMAYKKSLQVEDAIIYEALKESVNTNTIIGFHCENGDLIYQRIIDNLECNKTKPYYHAKTRPDLVEMEAINRVLTIANLANAPAWIVHLSTVGGLHLINEYKKNSQNIIVETCPQYLLLDESLYGNEDDDNFEVAKYVISPPLRNKSNQEGLWHALSTGEIDFVSTDHCSFNYKGQKELGKNDYSKIPNGAPGVEHRVLLMYTYGVCENKITINQMVKLLSYDPALIFGLKNKGQIKIGKDADIVILNPNKNNVITYTKQFQNVDYTPYENFEVKAEIEKVFLRGQLCVDNNKILPKDANGIFIKREPFTAKKYN